MKASGSSRTGNGKPLDAWPIRARKLNGWGEPDTRPLWFSGSDPWPESSRLDAESGGYMACPFPVRLGGRQEEKAHRARGTGLPGPEWNAHATGTLPAVCSAAGGAPGCRQIPSHSMSVKDPGTDRLLGCPIRTQGHGDGEDRFLHEAWTVSQAQSIVIEPRFSHGEVGGLPLGQQEHLC